MESKIDWSKAPADATHYQAATHGVFECWLKPGHAVRVSRREQDWREDEYADDLIATSAIKRPWSGEGLPPVGVVCEVDWCEEWHKCEVIAHFQQRCGMVAAFTVEISDGAKSLDAFGAGSFRPIRTPEQIESDARIKAAQEWLKSIELEYGEDVADQCENILMAAEEKRMDKL